MPVPTLCIFHGNCQDGFSAAWAVWKRYGDALTYFAATHGKEPPDVTGQHVLIVDFSYKQPVLKAMAAKAASITILDHHRSALHDLCGLLEDGTIAGIFDMNKSGAVLTWEHCHPNDPVPTMLRHVQDRDLWQFKLDDTRELTSCIFSHDYGFACWDDLVSRCEDPLTRRELVCEGAAIERKHMKDIKELLSEATRTMVIGGVAVPVANLPYTMASDAGNLLAQNAAFGACYYDRGDGKRSFSLRSIDGGADVSAIAAQYGGGGHFHAAGFSADLGWEGDRAPSQG